jgi:hypothetical protein
MNKWLKRIRGAFGVARQRPPDEIVATDLYAYSFRSPLSLAEVLERFRTLGPWRWIERDNDNWGEYISARALDDLHGSHAGMVKLITDDEGHRPLDRFWGSGRGRFIINVYLRADQPGARAEFATVRDTIFQRLLPAISATHIRKTDDLES